MKNILIYGGLLTAIGYVIYIGSKNKTEEINQIDIDENTVQITSEDIKETIEQKEILNEDKYINLRLAAILGIPLLAGGPLLYGMHNINKKRKEPYTYKD